MKKLIYRWSLTDIPTYELWMPETRPKENFFSKPDPTIRLVYYKYQSVFPEPVHCPTLDAIIKPLVLKMHLKLNQSKTLYWPAFLRNSTTSRYQESGLACPSTMLVFVSSDRSRWFASLFVNLPSEYSYWEKGRKFFLYSVLISLWSS